MSRASESLVTIGLPVFNGSPMLAETVAGLLAQTHRHLRLVVSDNASTDDTESICRAAAAADSRVTYYRQETNLGPWPNFRFVLDQAEGPLFMWASHDDAWHPRYVETCVQALNSRPDLGIAFTRFASVLRRDGQVVSRKEFPSFEPILSLDVARRLGAWILLDEYSQKANLIYGVWRTPLAREAMSRFGHLEDMVYKGLDIIMLTYVLARSPVHQVDEILFTKQYEGYLLGSATSLLRPITSFLTRPVATVRKATEFARDHCHHLEEALAAAGVLTPGLRRVIRLKRLIYFLPVYRYLTSPAAVLTLLRLRGRTRA